MFQTMTTENLFGTTWKSGTNVVHYVITDTLPWTIHESAGPAVCYEVRAIRQPPANHCPSSKV